MMFLDRKVVSEYVGEVVSRETMEKLQVYCDLLIKWNNTINLVSKSSINQLDTRHFYDSAQLWKYREEFDLWLDIGSGAGFPGLVMAILSEGKGDFHLVESDARKSAFLRNVSRETNVNVTVHTARIEEIIGIKADIISARALASLDKLLAFSENILAADGICLYLKGQSSDMEISVAKNAWEFSVEKYKSETEVEGAILKVRNIERAK